MISIIVIIREVRASAVASGDRCNASRKRSCCHQSGRRFRRRFEALFQAPKEHRKSTERAPKKQRFKKLQKGRSFSLINITFLQYYGLLLRPTFLPFLGPRRTVSRPRKCRLGPLRTGRSPFGTVFDRFWTGFGPSAVPTFGARNPDRFLHRFDPVFDVGDRDQNSAFRDHLFVPFPQPKCALCRDRLL